MNEALIGRSIHREIAEQIPHPMDLLDRRFSLNSDEAFLFIYFADLLILNHTTDMNDSYIIKPGLGNSEKSLR